LAFRSFAINTNPEREGEKGETASDPEDKPKDKEQLYGDPGEVKEEGYKETKIGEDGKATTQRHNTDHNAPKQHSNPHDHEITWDGDRPIYSKPINYRNGSVPEIK
jgi:hypothetical protein